MDYEKAYKEALERAKGLIDFCSDSELKTLENVFPELRESKDERIRKDIISYLALYKDAIGEEYESWIAWLEKQGELVNSLSKGLDNAYERIDELIQKNNLLIEQLEKQGEQRSTEVKPKFKVGDWVIDKQGIVHQIANVIENVTYHTYGYDLVGGGYFNDNTEGVKLWTIQDAKDGDVLATINKNIFIFKSINNYTIHDYCGLYFGDFMEYSKAVNNPTAVQLPVGYHPATKEQRDILEKAMVDAGYTFDFEKKELKKIEEPENYKNQVMSETTDLAKDYITQEPTTWNEEDELLIRELESLVKQVWTTAEHENDKDKIHKMSNLSFFLKTLKPQLKQEWGEKEQQIIEDAASFILSCVNTAETKEEEEKLEDLADKLQDLRPQKQWKPSEEQMKALWNVYQGGEEQAELATLYNDLKKLKG